MIFVTGGTGLLGSHLLLELAQREKPIRAVYRSEQKLMLTKELFQYYLKDKSEVIFKKIEWIKGDILDVPFLESAMNGCHEVYHCAAIVSFHKKDFNRMIRVNREGTFNMVNVALLHNVKQFCYVSSTAALGSVEGIMINEDTPWKNGPDISGYSVSKYSAEKEVWRGVEEGLNAVIVNPSVIIGAGDWNESSLTMFKTIQKGLKYYPSGGNATVDARDVVQIMLLLMDKQIFNERFLCVGSNQSFEHLMTVISKAMSIQPPSKSGKKSLVKVVKLGLDLWSLLTGKRTSITSETIENLYATRKYDNSKVKRTLNFEFTSLEESVKNAVNGRIH